MQLDRLLEQIERRFAKAMRQQRAPSDAFELNYSEYDYLKQLQQAPGIQLTELAERVNVSKSSASAMLSKLVQRGWVSRGASLTDKRQLKLSLTSAAETLLVGDVAIYQQMASQFAQGLSEDELQQLNRLLGKALHGGAQDGD